MELNFKEVSGKDNIGDFTWIHSSGQQAIIADMVSGTDTELGVNLLNDWLLEHHNEDVFDCECLFEQIHQLFIQNRVQAALGVITKVIDHFSCSVVGNLRLYKIDNDIAPVEGFPLESQLTSAVGQSDFPKVTKIKLDCSQNCLFVLLSDGIGHDPLLTSNLTFESMQAGDLYKKFIPAVVDKDWSAIVFPISQTQTYVKQTWPYNPFVGVQEERFHERRGLSEIATELFNCPQFNGFRIVSCPPVLSANSSRLFDGLLVYPFGVIPLELKDHHGDINIEIATNRTGSLYVSNELGEITLSNPVKKLRDALRKFGDLPMLKGLIPELKNTGIVIFTSPNANVHCLHNGQSLPTPFTGEGEVMVTQTHQLNDMLVSFCKKQFGKKLKSRLDESEINRIVKLLIAPSQEVNSDDENVQIGSYQISRCKIETESTDYYQLYEAWFHKRPIWVKCFSFDHLSAVHRQAEMDSLGREARILDQLGPLRLPTVQYLYGQEVTEDNLYIFLEKAPSTNLLDWIATSPSRKDRIKLLIVLAETIKEIQTVEELVIHRAINPYNVRINDLGGPVLVNFELCQLETIATLPVNARRTFTHKYQAPEVNQPGQSLTFAVDIYSLGLLAYQVLTGELPFKESSNELWIKSRRPGFWTKQCTQMGIAPTYAEFLQRIFHRTAKHRPDIEMVIEVFNAWK